jgi:hypothetical protein
VSALPTTSSPTVPETPSLDSRVSDGIHPDDIAQLPEIIDGLAIDTWYTVIVGVSPGVYHDWLAQFLLTLPSELQMN